MKVLIIGGTGTISYYVVKECLSRNMDVFVLNRGNHPSRMQEGVRHIKADINDTKTVGDLLENHYFNTVIEFVGFVEKDVLRDVEMFREKTDQYIFISSASAYQKPVKIYPMTEETPLSNPFWSYSQNKIKCEMFLKEVKDLNITIVRPSHTYDERMIVANMVRWQYEYAHIQRLLNGKPVIVPGDGTSLWTLTHAEDFAHSFVSLIGNKKTYGQAYQITSEEVYTWDQLTHILANALGVKAKIIHIPTDVIINHIPEMEGPLLGDKTWSAIFDNSKIKSLTKDYRSKIRYEDVVEKVINHYDQQTDLKCISQTYEKLYDQLIKAYHNPKNSQ